MRTLRAKYCQNTHVAKRINFRASLQELPPLFSLPKMRRHRNEKEKSFSNKRPSCDVKWCLKIHTTTSSHQSYVKFLNQFRWHEPVYYPALPLCCELNGINIEMRISPTSLYEQHQWQSSRCSYICCKSLKCGLWKFETSVHMLLKDAIWMGFSSKLGSRSKW